MSRPERIDDARAAVRPDRALIVGERTIHVSVAAPSDSLAALRRIDGAGIELSDFRLRRPTLDDVFLELTGEPATPRATDDVQVTP